MQCPSAASLSHLLLVITLLGDVTAGCQDPIALGLSTDYDNYSFLGNLSFSHLPKIAGTGNRQSVTCSLA